MSSSEGSRDLVSTTLHPSCRLNNDVWLLPSHGRREMSWKQVLLIILQMLPAHSRCWAVGQRSSGAPVNPHPSPPHPHPRPQEHPAFPHIRNQPLSIWAATDGLHRCHIINTELLFIFSESAGDEFDTYGDERTRDFGFIPFRCGVKQTC